MKSSTLPFIFLIFLGQAAALTYRTESHAESSQECQIWDDPQGVVHVLGKNEESALACWGYVHARDRAWQMDHLRRIVEGRTAEVYGSSALKSDITFRLLDLMTRAEKIFLALSSQAQDRFQAYASGVNQAFQKAQRDGVYEFKKLGIQPEPWRPAHSIALILLQSFDQTRNSIQQEIKEMDWLKDFGKDASVLFSHDGNPWDTSILKTGEYRRKEATLFAEKSGINPIEYESEENIGSNNWILSRSRSRSATAWLANDPHLGLKHPPFWHLAHIEGGDLDVIGASVPGFPFVASGSNRKVAWGLTTSFFDVADLSYVDESELKEAQTFYPLVWIRFWKIKLPFFFKSIRRTAQGLPILPMDAPKGKAVVLRWTGFLIDSKDVENIHTLMLSKNAVDASNTLIGVGIPTWNYVFADTKGSIGYRVTGHLPKMERPAPLGIQNRTLKEVLDWKMLLPSEHPSAFNPARGYLVSANNRQWPKDAFYDGGRAYHMGFRAQRIEELLTSEAKHDLESQRKIQCDVYASDAKYLAPFLISTLEKNPAPALSEKLKTQILAVLKPWDYITSVECTACPIYRRWMEQLKELSGLNEGAIYRVSKSARAQEIQPVVMEALKKALTDLKISEGSPLPQWGDLHRAVFSHLSDSSSFESSYDLKTSLATPGDKFTVNPGSLRWEKDHWIHTDGASQRLLVEMTDPPRVYSALTGPNRDLENKDFQAHPNAWDPWLNCELQRRNFPLDWSKVQAEKVKF